MKKVLFSVIILLCCGCLLQSCDKERTLTIEPSMTATIGTAFFNADFVEPALVKSQINDTGTTLYIRGYQVSTKDTIILSVTKYKEIPGTFSIVQGQASASYRHNGVRYDATGGIVAIKDASGNVINGYFNFSTIGTTSITNGTFVCGRPWVY